MNLKKASEYILFDEKTFFSNHIYLDNLSVHNHVILYCVLTEERLSTMEKESL